MKHFFFLLTLGLLIYACTEQQTEALPETIKPVKYGKVIRSGGKKVFSYSGVAQSSNETNMSFRVAGTVRTVNVKLGDRIAKGQLIATLDPTDYSIQAEQAVASEKGSEANLESAKTQLINSEANYRRVEKLYENNSVPLSEYEQAKGSYESALASFDAAQTQVTSSQKQSQSARNQVDYTRLVAPFSGVITSVMVEENELVGSGNPVAVLSAERDPEVNVGIPENVIAKIEKGQKVGVHFSVVPDQDFEGRVEEVSFAAGSSPTYPAIIRITNPSKEIRPGMAATVTFSFLEKGSAGEKLYLVSPVPSIGADQDGNFAFVLKAKNNERYTVEKRPVKVGALLPDGFEVLEGLKEDELVATAGIKSLLNGMEVKLLEEN